ncbi:FAD-dependent oxidoreductase [bacterium]|nr:FAD-dependent oxidoreductase [bacterium]
MRSVIAARISVVAVLAASLLASGCGSPRHDFDLVVLGGTPGGVAAAVAGARQGLHVCLLVEGEHPGGTLSSGPSYMDQGNPELMGGLAREVYYGIARAYRESYGPESQQYKDCAGGLRFEPHVAEAVLEALLKKERVTVYRGLRFVDTELALNQIQSLRLFRAADGDTLRVGGTIFVDATCSGDLAAEVGAPYRVGRESRAVFDEPLAGFIFQAPDGALLPGSTGAGDSLLQAAGFCLCLTDSAANQAPWPEPQSYDPRRYGALLGYIRETGAASVERFVRLTALPGRKWAVEGLAECPLTLDLPGAAQAWPEAGPEKRASIERAQLDFALGLFKFLRSDPGVPEPLRQSFARLAPAADEFVDNSNLPRGLHLRETRRLDGRSTFTQADALSDTLKPDAVALADFPLQSAAVSGTRTPGGPWPEGCFLRETRSHQLGYTLMLPAWLRNLLVPVAMSSSHVGWCGFNREPVFMQTGQAAGVAAELCIRYNCEVDEIPLAELQDILRQQGAILTAAEARPWEP